MAQKKKARIIYEPPSADEIVRLLKRMVVEYFPKTPFSIIAAKLGIPEKRLRKAMQGKDLLMGFQWQIMDALAESKGGPIFEAPSDSAAEEKKALSLKELERLRIWQLKVIDELDQTVFCSILGQDIAPHRCLEIQGQPECFGCAAGSRFCEQCHIRTVAFPEIELCSVCLAKMLESEQDIRIPEFPKNAKVECPLASRTISISACRSMQSAECGICEAQSRICEDCRQRPVRYPEYGVCLHCGVKMFGDDWLERKEALIAEQNQLAHRIAATQKKEDDKTKEKTEKPKRRQAASKKKRKPVENLETSAPPAQGEWRDYAQRICDILQQEQAQCNLYDLLFANGSGIKTGPHRTLLKKLRQIVQGLTMAEQLAVIKQAYGLREKNPYVYH